MANILIVDDDPVYGDMAKQRLERAGHRVSVHVGPFGATVAARKPDLDLVILDVFMPGLRGPDLLKLIRENRSESHALIVFCSSMDAEPLRELAAEYGADGSIAKSAQRVDLLRFVSSLLVNEMVRKRVLR
jgi:CitB family two-component system response regulator MalR